MKSTTAAVINLLDAAMAAPDAPIAFAECFTFITTTGTQYTWTNVDYPVTYNGSTFLANGPLVQGLKYKGTIGLEVDKQQITIAARPTDSINGAPFLVALRDGAFDGAPVYRDRVFLTAPNGTVVGGVSMFQGRVSTVDNVGRTSATLTVASDLVILDYDMPRNLFSPTCVHTLYDSGCGVVRGTYSVSGTCGAGSTSITIFFGGALAIHAQGSLVFTSGANANVRATVKSVNVGVGADLDVSAALRAVARRRLHGRCGLRPHPGDLPRDSSTICRTSAASPTCRRRRWPTEGKLSLTTLLDRPRPTIKEAAPPNSVLGEYRALAETIGVSARGTEHHSPQRAVGGPSHPGLRLR